MTGSRAFTLIEILIVFAVIGILTGLTLTSYRSSSEIRTLEREARRITDTYSLAFKKGYSSETGPLAQCSDFTGYQIALNPASRQYTLRKCCDAACAGGQSTVLVTHTLQSAALAFTAPAGTTTYLFRPLTAGAVITPAGSGTVTVRSSTIGKCISIDVGGAGTIQEHAKTDC